MNHFFQIILFMTSSGRALSLVSLSTFVGDPSGENVAEQLSIFRNHDIAYTESDQLSLEGV
jgi:hypothetical protein